MKTIKSSKQKNQNIKIKKNLPNSKLFTKIDKISLFSTDDKTTNRNSVTQQINFS